MTHRLPISDLPVSIAVRWLLDPLLAPGPSASNRQGAKWLETRSRRRPNSQRRRYSRTASTRRDSVPVEGSPSLSKTLDTYLSAARTVITSRSAMPALELPAAISSSTSRSRGVSRSNGSSLRRRRSRLLTICGSIEEPPVATRRTASRKSATSLIRSLQQVAHALRGFGQQLHGQSKVDVLREHQHCHLRMVPADLQRRPHAFVTVRGRQPDVDDGDARRLDPGPAEKVIGVAVGGDHVHPRPREDAG